MSRRTDGVQADGSEQDSDGVQARVGEQADNGVQARVGEQHVPKKPIHLNTK